MNRGLWTVALLGGGTFCVTTSGSTQRRRRTSDKRKNWTEKQMTDCNDQTTIFYGRRRPVYLYEKTGLGGGGVMTKASGQHTVIGGW